MISQTGPLKKNLIGVNSCTNLGQRLPLSYFAPQLALVLIKSMAGSHDFDTRLSGLSQNQLQGIYLNMPATLKIQETWFYSVRFITQILLKS
jgi:hypothetical protein